MYDKHKLDKVVQIYYDNCMAKIKSTLDLVLERTKNLNVTDSDRQALHNKEAEDNAKAWVHEYLHKDINIEKLKSLFETEKKKNEALTPMLRRELLGQADPYSANTMVYEALRFLFNEDIDKIDKALADYRKKIEDLSSKHIGLMEKRFVELGISGSSVIPNINNDAEWQEFLSTGKAELVGSLLKE